MRRPVIAGMVIGATLAAAPLAGLAAAPPSVDLTSPAGGDSTNGDLRVRWSYRALHPTTPVYVDVVRGSTVVEHVWVDDIDDGSKGSFGSHTLSTASWAEAADYEVRIVVATNRRVTSTVTGFGIDRTGPTASVDAEPVTDPLPAAVILSDVTGTAGDAIAGVKAVAVTFTGPVVDTRQATCTSCGSRTASVTWSAATDGLPAGEYTVTAVATDNVNNVGAPSEAELVIVGMPEDPTPAVREAATTMAEAVAATATATLEQAVDTVTTTTEGAVDTATSTTTADEVVEAVTAVAAVTSVTDAAQAAGGGTCPLASSGGAPR